MWRRIESTIKRIIPIPVTNTEKAFGLQLRNKKERNAIILRNWITFTLRHMIMEEERRAFHIPRYYKQSVETFFAKYNKKTQDELKMKKMQYDYRQLSIKFKEIVTTNTVVASEQEGQYTWMQIM